MFALLFLVLNCVSVFHVESLLSSPVLGFLSYPETCSQGGGAGSARPFFSGW